MLVFAVVKEMLRVDRGARRVRRPNDFKEESMKPVKITTTLAVLAAAIFLVAGCDMFVDDATRIERAKASVAEKNFRTAEIELKNVLRGDSGNLEARSLLGEVMLARGDVEAAIKELRRARELGAPAETYVLPLARALMRKQDFAQIVALNPEELADQQQRAALFAIIGRAEQERGNLMPAREHLEKALAIDPVQPDALIGLAHIARERGDPEQAERQLQRLLDAHPDNHDGLSALATMQHSRGLYREAEATYAHAIESASQPGDVYKRLEYRIGLIEAQLAQGDAERAQQSAAEAMADSNDHPAALMQAARADLAAGDFDAAIEKTERIVTLAPDFAPPRLLLAAAAIAKGNNSLAANQLQGVLQNDPEHTVARKMLAQAQMNLGSPDQALAVLQPLLNAGANDAQLLAMAGTASIRSGNQQAGVELMERGVEASSADPAIKLQAAANFLTAGEINKAIEVLESLPDSEQIGNRDLLLILALLRKGDEEAARAQAQSILDARPGDITAHRLMGGFHLAVGEFDAARVQFGKALAIDPNDIASIVHMARIDVELNEADQAEQRFRDLLKRQPGNVIALSALAQLKVRSGDRAGAVTLLEQAREANPREVGPMLTLARYYLQTNELAKAADRASEAARAAPANSDAHMLLGAAQLAQGRASESLGSLERAVELSPNSAVAHFHLGRAQEQIGTLDAAALSYQRATDLQPDLYLAHAGRVSVAYRRGDFNRALEMVKTLAEKHPDRIEPVILRGDVELARGDAEAALVAYEQAAARQPSRDLAMKRARVLQQLGRKGFWTVLADWVAENPDDAQARALLADALATSGDTERALVEYERAYAAAPSAATATSLARLHGRARRVDESVQWLNKALELEPNLFIARAAMAELEIERGNLDKALKLAQSLRGDFPDRSAAHRVEGDALMAKGQHRAAVEAYQRAAAIEPSQLLTLRLYGARKEAGDSKATRTLEQWAKEHPGDAAVSVQLGGIYTASGEHEKAIDAYRRVLETQPDNVVALNNLAWIYFQRGGSGDLQRGIDTAQRAYRLRSDIGAIADTYGWLLLQDGRVDEAMVALRDAVSASPENAEISYHYAVALHRNGNSEQARALLDKILATGDEFDGLDDARKLRQEL